MTGPSQPEGVLYLYAITDRPQAPLPPARGIGNAPLTTLRYRALAAIMSAHDPADVKATERALWEHEAVCEALLNERAVLPARFGIVFSDRERVHAELARRYDELVGALRRVAGRVELGVRVLAKRRPGEEPQEALGTPGVGRAYLEAKAEERRSAEEVARTVHEALVPLAVASRRRVLMSPGVLLSAAYLVARSHTDAFARRVAELQRDSTEVSLICTGPWPPYSFVENDGDRDG